MFLLRKSRKLISLWRTIPRLRSLLRGEKSNALFDHDWYLQHYPDVELSDVSPFEHYRRHGAAEGRDPNPLFDTRFYLKTNPDVLASGANPLEHYLRHGAAEGRDPNPLFDTRFYLKTNPDVLGSGLNPLLHYVRHGAAEGRDPHPLFDTRFYLANNPDVRACGANPLQHYLWHGAAEERDPNPLFDTRFYLANNPDVRACGANPLRHYLRHGAAEGRDPHPLFDTRFYLANNPDVRACGANPLRHYLWHGAAEGRTTKLNRASTAVVDAGIQCLKAPAFQQGAFDQEIALFVTHSPHGRLKPHVRHYLDSLKRQQIAVILIVAADKPFLAADVELVNALDGIFIRSNEGYDFAAWAHILRLHPELFDAKILYLLNDSLFGPTNDDAFGALLEKIRKSSADFVGLTDNYECGWHIQSYFLAIKQQALASVVLHDFINGVVSYTDKNIVINEYEVPFATVLMNAGLACEPIFASTHEIVNHTIFYWKKLIKAGFPFVKVTTVRDNFPGVDISGWREVLAEQGYDVSLAEKTLKEAERSPQPASASAVPPGEPAEGGFKKGGVEPEAAGLERDGQLRSHAPKFPPWRGYRRTMSGLGRLLRGRRSNPLFDPDWYLRRYPDVERSAVDPYDHYLRHGAAEGRDPNPLFDTNWYLEQNPDVKESGVNPLLHYYLAGRAEGRDPHPLFSTSWYCAKVGLPSNDPRNPLIHFLAEGTEKRIDPNPFFNGAWYRAQHSEIDDSRLDPILYYVEIGAQKGHCTTPLFDASWYAACNADVREDKAFDHFLRYGCKEGRNPNPYFDSKWYAKVYHTMDDQSFLHYITQPSSKYNDPSPLFDSSEYMKKYSGYIKNGHDCLSNYIITGIDKGFDRFEITEAGIDQMRVAVIAHIYYDDIWPQIAEALSNIPIKFDLYLTIPSDRVERLSHKVLSKFPDAKIVEAIREGRDIGPFFQALTEIGNILSYDVICKIHTKKGMTQPDVWRYILLRSVLGNQRLVGDIIRTFQAQPNVGLIGPKELYISGPKFIGPNGQNVSELAKILYPHYDSTRNWGFMAGSMFWFRPGLLMPLAQHVRDKISFETDSSLNDGQIAHALERMIGMILSLEGLDVGLVNLALQRGDDLPIQIGSAQKLTAQEEPTDYLTRQAELMRGLYPVSVN